MGGGEFDVVEPGWRPKRSRLSRLAGCLIAKLSFALIAKGREIYQFFSLRPGGGTRSVFRVLVNVCLVQVQLTNQSAPNGRKMLKGLRANAILTIVVALLLSAFLARQEQSRASRSEESASGKTPITSPSRMAPKGIPDNPTLSRKEFLSVEERLGLENPPPLLLESLNVLLSPPMIAEIQAQAVETRIQW